MRIVLLNLQAGWRLEGSSHSTIQELIIQQHKSKTAVTSKSGAILTTPIMRETWQIKNDDIKLEEKIGNVSCLGTILRLVTILMFIACNLDSCYSLAIELSRRKSILVCKVCWQTSCQDHNEAIKFHVTTMC